MITEHLPLPGTPGRPFRRLKITYRYSKPMLDRIAKEKCDEREGMVNGYLCDQCKEVIVTKLLTDGITPPSVTCTNCGATAESRKYDRLRYFTPTIGWIRAANAVHITELFAESLNGLPWNEWWTALNQLIEWWQGCGLFQKRL